MCEVWVYNVIDLITMIAQKVDSSISKKELEKIVLNVKEKKHLSEVKKHGMIAIPLCSRWIGLSYKQTACTWKIRFSCDDYLE